jgi:hypothetical protein
MADIEIHQLLPGQSVHITLKGTFALSTVTTLSGKKAVGLSVRAYVLLRLAKGNPMLVAQALRHKPGVLMADPLEGPPDVIVVFEAPERQKLADFTVQALSSVETMIENVRLLPIHS